MQRVEDCESIRRPGPRVTFTTDAGFYRRVMRSNKPQAAAFQDWVTDVASERASDYAAAGARYSTEY